MKPYGNRCYKNFTRKKASDRVMHPILIPLLLWTNTEILGHYIKNYKYDWQAKNWYSNKQKKEIIDDLPSTSYTFSRLKCISYCVSKCSNRQDAAFRD